MNVIGLSKLKLKLAYFLPAVETAARVTNPASAGFLRHTGGLYDPCSGFIHQALNTKVENDH
jgi:hypothetical protein